MSEAKSPRIETRLEVKNSTKSTAELYLYGSIRKKSWWDSDEERFISAEGVKEKLSELKGKDINIHLNSGGGDVFESIAISNLLKQHDGDINIVVDSLAGSGASIVAMAGKKVKMFPNSMMMIHKAMTVASGNADDLRKIAEDLDKIDSSVKASYEPRFVGTNAELEGLITDETWLTAEECKVFGFCDEIIEQSKEDQESEKGEEDKEEREPVKASLLEKYTADSSKKFKNKTLLDKFKGGRK